MYLDDHDTAKSLRILNTLFINQFCDDNISTAPFANPEGPNIRWMTITQHIKYNAYSFPFFKTHFRATDTISSPLLS